jgi:glucose/arabinose dehydrogenase
MVQLKNNKRSGLVTWCAAGAALAGALAVVWASAPRLSAHNVVDVHVIASGLNDPRGLAFGPGGDLYIAEAGEGGGTLSMAGVCDQVQAVGPFTGGSSGRVVDAGDEDERDECATGAPSRSRPDCITKRDANR